jgi:hypothetical protein
MSQENLQSSAKTTGLKSNFDWVMVVDYGAIGLTTGSLFILVIQLVFAGEPYRRGHSVLLFAALAGFLIHVGTSRILLQPRDQRITKT